MGCRQKKSQKAMNQCACAENLQHAPDAACAVMPIGARHKGDQQRHDGIDDDSGAGLHEHRAEKSMSDYVIPTSMDFPKQFYHIQENPYPWGPYGAKGMGELVFNGASAAYVDAVERALNTRFTSIPIPPEAIEEAMKHVH